MSQTHSPFSLWSSLRHGGQQIDERIGPEENKTPERQLKRVDTHTPSHTHKDVYVNVQGHLCVLSVLLLVKHSKWNLRIRLNCQSDGDGWLEDLPPLNTKLPLERSITHSGGSGGRVCVCERELIGWDTDKHRGQNDISMITLQQ